MRRGSVVIDVKRDLLKPRFKFSVALRADLVAQRGIRLNEALDSFLFRSLRRPKDPRPLGWPPPEIVNLCCVGDTVV